RSRCCARTTSGSPPGAGSSGAEGKSRPDMDATGAVSPPRTRRAAATHLAPPAWVARLFDASPPAERFVVGAAPFAVSVVDGARFTLVTARVVGAADM